MVYLDNAATTYPKPEQVYSAMDNANRFLAVNAGRGSYKLAKKANDLIVETKQLIRIFIGVDMVSEVVFSPSITIALNQIVNGLEFPTNSTVYLSPYEHNAVARTVYALSKKQGFTVKLLPLNPMSLEIDIERMKYDFSKEIPFAVFCTHVSNVTGYILPVSTIFEEAKKYGSLTILDSAQSLGLIPVNAGLMNVDIVAFAGHKTLYGPFGIGGFVNVTGINVRPFLTGGTGSDSLNLDMPREGASKFEAASPNIVAIAGLNAALKNVDVEKNYAHEKEITDYLVNKLKSNPKIHMYLPEDKTAHIGIVSFVHDDYSSDNLGMILDEDFDIAVRTGYHCAPYIHDYLDDKRFLGTVRVGVSIFSTKNDIDRLIEALFEIED